LLLESFATVATIFTTPPSLRDALVGESAMVIGMPDGVPLPPHPTRNPRVPTIAKAKKKLRTLSSLL
jgi:hypothetical protein